jgi:hypothetical protein
MRRQEKEMSDPVSGLLASERISDYRMNSAMEDTFSGFRKSACKGRGIEVLKVGWVVGLAGNVSRKIDQ